MRLSIRNPEADALAKRLAKLDDTTVTAAVIAALKEAIAARLRRRPRPKPPAGYWRSTAFRFRTTGGRFLREPTTTSTTI